MLGRPALLLPGDIGLERYPSRDFVTHEYFHIMQLQLSPFALGEMHWVLEGMARLMERLDCARNFYACDSSYDKFRRFDEGPTLQSIALHQVSPEWWHYFLGAYASELLMQRAGRDALIEYYRVQVSGRSRTTLPWSSRPTSEAAFNSAFGIDLQEFYEVFERHRGGARPAHGSRYLSGQLRRENGVPIAGAQVAGISTGHKGAIRVDTSDENGEFELIVPQGWTNRLQVRLSDYSCFVWYAEGGATESKEAATILHPSITDRTTVDIVVSDDLCHRRISGRVIAPDGQALPWFRLQVDLQVDPAGGSAGG